MTASTQYEMTKRSPTVTSTANFSWGTGRILSGKEQESGLVVFSMRRCVILLALAAVAIAGCGSSSSKSHGPLPTELSYLPPNSPLVLTVETDPNGSAIKGVNALAAKFPLASLGEAALKSKLQQSGVNYDADLRPLFGNPIAFAATSPTLSDPTNNDFVFVWMTKDENKLKSLVKKLPGMKTTGSHDGATLYTSGGSTTVAVDGATIVLAPTAAQVNAALDRHAHGGGISSSAYSQAFSGLPSDGLLKVFGNLGAVLSRPSAAKARQVPWVAALRAYATTVSASSSGLTFSYRLDTSGRPLTTTQLPFAPGSTPPSFAGSAPITFSLHNPSQVASFFESAAQLTSPGSFARFLTRQAAVRKATGTDLNSLLKLFTGDLIIASDTKRTIGRVQVSDAGAARTTLSKLMSAPRGVFGPRTKVRRVGGFYAVTDANGSTVLMGLVGNQLVVGKATRAQLRAFAATPATPAPGAQGSVAFRVALDDLLHLKLRQSLPPSVAPILSSLGDITGWLQSSTSGVTGSATLAVK
jgi:hypothetical protein